MDYIYWSIIIILFVIAFAGLFVPVIPSVLFIIGGFLLYGVFFSFEDLNWLFWAVQGMFVVLLFGADYAANIIGVKKYGGSKAGVWGSTIGLLAGPFVIPVLGILIGPFIGAALAELLVHRKNLLDAVKIGFGSVVGFISSIVTKGVIQAIMLVYFYILI
ncbi:DUF456 domain-containing protein [Mesobacillus foraminis]|uniref:DUF456 family protein n=1 Tax=Mesobacillus foraminis TaxID=279826 RepID=A0A4R2B9X4_9BACI|nr:DUF456 domain-containing protein [Mesobacillus foraminis]MBT2754718.1 DUF456 domain-containing protein [Mesobacillus foraminis]TCN22852.1 hypothetical protein EV146_1095 [Mesobacillus foraminis]